MNQLKLVTAKGTVKKTTQFFLVGKTSDTMSMAPKETTVIEILQKHVQITVKTDSRLRNILNKIFASKRKGAKLEIQNFKEVLHKGDKIYNREDERVLTVHSEDIPVWPELQKRWTKAKVGNTVTVYISLSEEEGGLVNFEI